MKQQGNQGSSASNLILYKASAGSGKTFMLAVEYISMVVRDPQSYKSILAVTFTNKATAEMKQRILSQLYGIANSLPDSENYINKVKELVPNKSDAEIRANCAAALNNILQDYGHFRVETIDSFFQTILRGLARELQLGATLNLEIDTNKVISDAVREFMAHVEPGSAEADGIQTYIEENIENDRYWNIEKNLNEFAGQLFSETFNERGKELQNDLKDVNIIPQYRKKIKEYYNDFRKSSQDSFNSIMNTVSDIIDKNGLEGKFNSNTTKLIDQLLSPDKSIDDHCGLLAKATIANCTASGANYFTSKTLGKDAGLENTAQEYLVPQITLIYNLLTDYLKEKNTCEQSLSYLHELGLLMKIREEIDNQNREQDRFILSDTATLLDKLKVGDSSFVFEKTGNFTEHIMIDEFQDTSRLQWKNFYILLLECLSKGKECLVVGDVKQSIYRWRNSDWNIFNQELEESLKQYSPKTIPLSTNHRSCSNVINYNNYLFDYAKKVASDSYKELTGNQHDRLEKAYEKSSQETCGKEGGYVYMDIVEKDKDLGKDEAMCRKILETIRRLQEKGVKQNDIAILIRYKRNIYTIADWFAANAPEIKMVSNEAFMLKSSASVRILMNTVRWLADRTDTVSLAAMLWEWNSIVRGEEISIEKVLSGGVEKHLPDGLAGQWDILRHLPLYEMIERIINALRLEDRTEDSPYVMAFLDATQAFTKSKPNDLTLFIQEWEEKIQDTAIPVSIGDGIRLVTIHKSKGLEFHTVIVPYCDWELVEQSGRKETRIWVETNRAPFNDIKLLPLKFGSKLRDSHFADSYKEEAALQYVDNLNLLYVAFTRAEKNLIALGMVSSSKNGTMSNVSDLVSCFMNHYRNNQKENLPLNSELHADVDSNDENSEPKFEIGSIVPSNTKFVKVSENPFSITPESKTIELHTTAINARFKQSGDSKRFVQYSQDEDEGKKQDSYINQGLLFHSLFESIGTESDIDACVEQAYYEGVIDTQADAEEIKKQIHSHIENTKGAKQWFNGNYKLYNEKNIICRQEENATPRRPDRIMIMDDGRAVVIDYKFGNEYEDHMRQVQEYMGLLEQMGYRNVEGHIWYVFKNKVIDC